MKPLRIAGWALALSLLLITVARPQGEPKNETHQNQDGTWTQTNTYPDGSKKVTEMDKDLHKIKETQYDAKGNKTEESDWAWNSGEKEDVMRVRHIYPHGRICESVEELDERGVRTRLIVLCGDYILVDTYKAGKRIKREKIVGGKLVDGTLVGGKVVKTERFDDDGNLIQQSIDQPPPPPVVTPEDHATGQLIGIVYDKDSRPGDQVTMSLTTDPRKYRDIPGLGVIEIQGLALAAGHSSLQGMVVDLGDGRKQPADQPLTIRIAGGLTAVPISVGQGDTTTPAAQASVPLAQGASPSTVTNTGNPSDFNTPPVVQITSVIHGPLSGDGNLTHIAVDSQPAAIIAGTPRSVYYDLPANTKAGPHTLTLHDQNRTLAAPIVKLDFIMQAGQLRLQRGQSTNYTATVYLGQLPDSVWRKGGNSPELITPLAAGAAPRDFHVPQPGEPAVVLLRIENASRDTVTLKPSHNEATTRVLHQQDFQNGQFTEAGALQSKRSGGFTINGTVRTYFAPITFKEATAPAASASNAK